MRNTGHSASVCTYRLLAVGSPYHKEAVGKKLPQRLGRFFSEYEGGKNFVNHGVLDSLTQWNISRMRLTVQR